MAVLGISASTLVADFFKNPEISSLMFILFSKFVVDSFGMVHEALLKREMSFKKIALIEIPSTMVFVVVAVMMALNDFGINSMAWGYLSKSLVKVLLLWQAHYFRPHLKFDLTSFRELFRFGKNIVGFKILSYISGSLDLLLIGRLLGTTSLGYYSLALNLANFPRQKLSSIISTVAFPGFSRMQDDLSAIRRAYLKVVRYAATINFPLLVGLILLSPQFVRVVYSSKWIGMVLPLQILCVYGICFSITTFVGIVFNSTGHPEYSFKFSLVTLAGAVLAVLSGLKYNLVGITLALSIYAIIMNILGHLVVRHLIRMNFISYLQSMIPAAISSIVMSSGLLLLIRLQKSLFPVSEVWFLLLMVSSGAVIYVVALFSISRQTLAEVIDVVHKMFKIHRLE